MTGKLPPNNEILYQIQTILALLPNLSLDPLRTSMFESQNDQHLALYMAGLVRSVTALHDLVNNKAKFRDIEEGGEKKDEKETEKEKDEKGDKAEKGKEDSKEKKDAKK